MRSIQGAAGSSSDDDFELDLFETKDDSGWSDDTQLDRFARSKETRAKIIKKANQQISLLSLLKESKVQLIEKYSPSGWTHSACCPFPDHDDSTPSFGYNSITDAFNCYGCQRGGRAVQYLAYLNRRNDFYQIAKEILGRSIQTEALIQEIHESDKDKTDEILEDFFFYVYEFVSKHRGDAKAFKYVNKITYQVDLYISKNAFKGTMSAPELAMRIQKLKKELDLFEEFR